MWWAFIKEITRGHLMNGHLMTGSFEPQEPVITSCLNLCMNGTMALCSVQIHIQVTFYSNKVFNRDPDDNLDLSIEHFVRQEFCVVKPLFGIWFHMFNPIGTLVLYDHTYIDYTAQYEQYGCGKTKDSFLLHSSQYERKALKTPF